MSTDGFTRDFSMADLEILEPEGQFPTRRVADARGTIPQFFTLAVRDDARSEALGAAKYRELEMVRLFIPGDKNNIVEKRVTPTIRVQYAREYEAWKKRQELTPDGTLIDNWAFIGKAQVRELKALHIYTVETLAELGDDKLGAIGIGAKQLRRHAQEYLKSAQTGAMSTALVAENEALKNQISLLTSQVADMARRMESMMVKAGEKPEDAAYNPMTQARLAVSAATGVNLNVSIPENYTQLGLPKLRDVIAKFTQTPVRSKEEALEMIEEYLGKKSLVAA